MRGNKVITRVVLAVSLLGGALLGASARAPAWGSPTTLAHLSTNPSSGPAGAKVELRGKGFVPNKKVTVLFLDANGAGVLFWIWASSTGSFKAAACIPTDATAGADMISAASPGDLSASSPGRLSMDRVAFYVIPGAAQSHKPRLTSAEENICLQ